MLMNPLNCRFHLRRGRVMPPRRASLKLDNQAGLRLLVEEAGDLLSRHAPDGVYRYASPAAARLLGYDPAELVGRPVFELFHPEELDLAREAHEALHQSGGPMLITHRLRGKDGRYHWFECSLRALQDPVTHAVTEIHSISRDVTTRRLSEERLRLSERRYREIVDQLPVAVVLHGKDATILSANRAARELFHASDDQLQGRTAFNPYWLVVGPTGAPFGNAEHPVRQVLQSGEPIHGAWIGVPATRGRTRWLQVDVVPQQAPDGRVRQVMAAYRPTPGREEVQHAPPAGTDHRILPICAQCKKVRGAEGEWEPLEAFLNHIAGLRVSHSLCPRCAAELFPDQGGDDSATA